MTHKEILLLAFHTQAGSISRKKDVCAPTAQNAVSVCVHLEQVFPMRIPAIVNAESRAS